MSAAKVIFATLVIFIAGIVTGALLMNVNTRLHFGHFSKNPASANNLPMVSPWQLSTRNLVKRMDRELGLTPEQYTELEKLVAASQDRTKHLWKPITPQMNREVARLHQEMREVLTDDQRRRFDAFIKARPAADRRRGATNANPLLTNSLAPSVITNTLVAAPETNVPPMTNSSVQPLVTNR